MVPALLHWCTVQPQGPSSLAAIRFAAPIRVSSIRVFPNGAQPFSQSPDIIAATEPDAFYLDVFFNALPIHPNTESKEKQRAANALIPTVIAYPGGQVDFTVDMGTEYATRLMIVRGKFENLSMAIYGQVVSESSPVNTYQPRPLPVLDPQPLSKAVDPSNLSDPTLLAKQLLLLIPDSPPLSLIVRLMLCLKPSDEDWDHPDFPYLYADLEKEEDFDLESIIQSIGRPVSEETSSEVFSKFGVRVVEFIGPKVGEYFLSVGTAKVDEQSIDQASQIAKILSISASQYPEMARQLLNQLDLPSIFDEETIDEPTALCLLDAVTNPDIARHFCADDAFLTILHDIQEHPRADKHTQAAVRRLLVRIAGWQRLEDALSNTQGDFAACARMLKDIGTEEQAVGIWLETMLIHEDLVTKLAENPVLPTTAQSQPPVLFRDPLAAVSHDDFVMFVRAMVGVASVLAVWAWADSIGHGECRERTMGILKLWQDVDGYREILNHLLLLRQFTRRLGWIATDNDPPRKSSFLAERMLSELAEDPHAILRDDLIKTILSLDTPLSFIPESGLLSLRKIALVAEDGLPAAVDELTFTSDRPFSLRRLRTLRVSLAILERELIKNANGERRVFETFWEEGSHGVVPRLVEIFSDISSDLNEHFTIAAPPKMNHLVADQLFRTADDLMRLITLLSPAFPLTTRALRKLTVAVADLFACTDMADMIFSQSSAACRSAQGTRQTCLDLIRSLSGPSARAEPGKLGAEVILPTLLDHAAQSQGRDPAYHLLQVFSLIDHILPDPSSNEPRGEESHWVTTVFPKVLSELKTLFRLLDTENKAHLIKRLVRLDEDVIGIGEWLLMEELKHFSQTLQILAGPISSPEYRLTQQYQVHLSIRFLADLITPSSNASAWCITALSFNDEIAELLTHCLTKLLEGYYSSLTFTQFAQTLAKKANVFSPEMSFTILLCLLRNAQFDPTSPSAFDYVLIVLKETPSSSLAAEPLLLELGRTLSAYAEHASILKVETATELLSVLEYLLSQGDSSLTILSGVSLESFSRLTDAFVSILPAEKADTIADVRLKISIDEDEAFAPSSPAELPESLELSLKSIENLLNPDLLVPSTPKAGNKTPDILGVVISPPNAVLRSHAATGLTKTYANNDFRQLRASPAARLNTSRLPSMHVDDFESSSPTLLTTTLLPVPDVFIQSLMNPGP